MSSRKTIIWLLALIAIFPILGGCDASPPTSPALLDLSVRLEPHWGLTVNPDEGDTDVFITAMAVSFTGDILASEPRDFHWYGNMDVEDGIFHVKKGETPYGLYQVWVSYRGTRSNIVQVWVLPPK